MGRRIVSGGCHPAERKNGDFCSSPASCHPTEKSWMEVWARHEECKTKWKIKNEVEKTELSELSNLQISYIILADNRASSCCADLRMKLPDTRPHLHPAPSVG
ncbi:unnamed protein product [Spirodela intermedia]|uniref:Uncharacterized protein n=1 Tax=Spirodela intermedia TaxID=51605 RepID=A0ABN7EDC9_SPIIN|nr:unnamed protein product [Spirodela intermedia]